MSEKAIPKDPDMPEGVIPEGATMNSLFAGVFSDEPKFITEADEKKDTTIAEEEDPDAEGDTDTDSEVDTEATGGDDSGGDKGDSREDSEDSSGEDGEDANASDDEDDSDSDASSGDTAGDNATDSDKDDSAESSALDKRVDEILGNMSDIPKGKGTRDYSGFTEAETKILKGTSNEAFKYVQKQAERLKELEEQVSSATTSDIDLTVAAVREDKDYKNTRDTISVVDAAIAHAKQQIINIEKGQQFAPIESDDKGNIGAGALTEPSPEAKLLLQEQQRELESKKIEFEKDLTKMETEYKSNVENSLTKVEDLIVAFEPSFKQKDSKLNALADQIQSKLPPIVAKSPTGKALAQAFALAMASTKGKKAAVKRAKGKERDAKDDAKSGMKKKHSGKGSGPKPVTMASFNAVLNPENRL